MNFGKFFVVGTLSPHGIKYLKDSGKNQQGSRIALMECVCGVEFTGVTAKFFPSEFSKEPPRKHCSRNCKFLNNELSSRSKTHGASRSLSGKPHPIYATYIKILSRLKNENDKSYNNYGGRGLILDPQINTYHEFLDMCGAPPNPSLSPKYYFHSNAAAAKLLVANFYAENTKGETLSDFMNFVDFNGINVQAWKQFSVERIDVNQGYIKNNIILIPKSAQARNKQNTVRNSEGVPAVDLAHENNFKLRTIKARIKSKKPDSDIILPLINNTSENKDFYVKCLLDEKEISVESDGRVFDLQRNVSIRPSLTKHGYLVVNLSGLQEPYFHHRIVALAFFPMPQNKAYVDHIDRCKSHNESTNLRWVDSVENSSNRSNVKPDERVEKFWWQYYSNVDNYEELRITVKDYVLNIAAPVFARNDGEFLRIEKAIDNGHVPQIAKNNSRQGKDLAKAICLAPQSVAVFDSDGKIVVRVFRNGEFRNVHLEYVFGTDRVFLVPNNSNFSHGLPYEIREQYEGRNPSIGILKAKCRFANSIAVTNPELARLIVSPDDPWRINRGSKKPCRFICRNYEICRSPPFLRVPHGKTGLPTCDHCRSQVRAKNFQPKQ